MATRNREEWIPMIDCLNGALYEVDARNFSIGIYDKKQKSFLGIRHKFKMVFIDSEEHWDNGPPHGTVKPIKLLKKGPLPLDKESVFRYLRSYYDKI